MSTKENKAVVRRWVEEVVNGKDPDVADEVLSADLVSSSGGREEYKNMVARLRTIFPDLNQSIDGLIAEGDAVIELWTISATHTGDDYRGVSPTGKRTEYPGVDIFRVIDGKIVEQRGVFNMLSLLEQLGFTVVPPQT